MFCCVIILLITQPGRLINGREQQKPPELADQSSTASDVCVGCADGLSQR
jgi:hypothetical protein